MAPQALAPPPQRAITTINIGFGPLINIPCSVYTGTETTRVERKEFLKGDCNVPVGRAPIKKNTGEVVDSADVTRMAEADNGAWVTLSDEEIAACTAPKGLAEIVCFVKNKDIDKYLVENVVQVRPKATKGRVDPGAEKAFALLLSVMAEKKVHALVYVAMRGPARYALLDKAGNLFYIYTADAIRNWRDLPLHHSFTDAEMKIAGNLVDAIGVDAPTLLDTTAPAVRKYVNEKAAGAPVPAAPAVPEAPPVDIMGQLLASIDAAKGGE